MYAFEFQSDSLRFVEISFIGAWVCTSRRLFLGQKAARIVLILNWTKKSENATIESIHIIKLLLFYHNSSIPLTYLLATVWIGNYFCRWVFNIFIPHWSVTRFIMLAIGSKPFCFINIRLLKHLMWDQKHYDKIVIHFDSKRAILVSNTLGKTKMIYPKNVTLQTLSTQNPKKIKHN